MKTIILFALILFIISISNAQDTCIALQDVSITNTGSICDNTDTLRISFALPYTETSMVSVLLDSNEGTGNNSIFRQIGIISQEVQHGESQLTYKCPISWPGDYGFEVTTVQRFGDGDSSKICGRFYLGYPIEVCISSIKEGSTLPENEIGEKEYFTLLGQPCQFTKGMFLIEKITTFTGEVAYRKVVRE